MEDELNNVFTRFLDSQKFLGINTESHHKYMKHFFFICNIKILGITTAI